MNLIIKELLVTSYWSQRHKTFSLSKKVFFFLFTKTCLKRTFRVKSFHCFFRHGKSFINTLYVEEDFLACIDVHYKDTFHSALDIKELFHFLCSFCSSRFLSDKLEPKISSTSFSFPSSRFVFIRWWREKTVRSTVSIEKKPLRMPIHALQFIGNAFLLLEEKWLIVMTKRMAKDGQRDEKVSGRQYHQQTE